MTDRDDDAKGFLERWSRKKIEGKREATDAPVEPAAAQVSPAGPPDNGTNTEPPAAAVAKPEFDLASLPSLDSIAAATDVRAFLSPGVPQQLARAALRRAWAADPAIRDFKGLAENDWDFTDPTAMPGFGELPPGYDIKKLVAQIFSHDEKPADPAAESQSLETTEVHIAEEIAVPAPQTEAALPAGMEREPGLAEISEGEQQVAQVDLVQRDNNIASHKSNRDDDTEEVKSRRQHGGALPQ